MRGLMRVVIFGLVILGLVAPLNASAQDQSQFFPETGFTVSGRFLDYWRSNGGLAVFGLPLSNELSENGIQVQYFERQRFELHPENRRPYDVLLGRLGAQLWGPASVPPDNGPRSGCIWFPETSLNVCNQQQGIGFASYWQRNGLEFDGVPTSKSYQESLALFGYPITGVVTYTSPDGIQVQAQWFERARFEWHPGNPNPYKVLLGRLGAETKPATPPPATVDRVQIYLISQGTGTIGCGDEAVAVTRQITPTQAPLQAALAELFSIKTADYGESGLYNALYQSDIRIDRVVIQNGQAVVALSGTIRLNGVCDEPRAVAQIEQTVRQFSSVTSTVITLNGQPLTDAV